MQPDWLLNSDVLNIYKLCIFCYSKKYIFFSFSDTNAVLFVK